MEINRVIAVKDFYGFGDHIYEDQLGFDAGIRKEFRSNVTRDIFVESLDVRFYELGFYYVDDGNFYFIATMEDPVQVVIMPKDPRLSRFVGWQCENPDDYGHGTILATYKTAAEVWEHFTINGKQMEEVIPRSYILRFC